MSVSKLRKLLTERYGENSETIVDELHKIAFGHTFEVVSKDGMPRYVQASIKDRREALVALLELAHGKPTQTVQVEAPPSEHKWNPDALSLAELEQLEQLTSKARGALPANVVDVVFEETNPKGEK